MNYDAKDDAEKSYFAAIEAKRQRGDAEIARLLRCIESAAGCLNVYGGGDERLAWYRLLDAVEGREPRASLFYARPQK